MNSLQKIITKRRAFVTILLVLAGAIVLCLGYFANFLVQENTRYTQAKTRIDSLNRLVPVPNGSALIKSVTGYYEAGGIDWCHAYGTHQLYGTNDFTIGQVVSFYQTALKAQGWSEKYGRNNFAHFISNKNDIFYRVNEANYSDASSEDVDQARNQFRTVFAIHFLTYWDDNLTRYCGDM